MEATSMATESFDVYPAGWPDEKAFNARVAEFTKAAPAELIRWLCEHFRSRQPAPPIKRKPSLRFRTHYIDRRIEIAPGWITRREPGQRTFALINGQLSFSSHSWNRRRERWEPVLELKWLPVGVFKWCRRPGDVGKALAELNTLVSFCEAATRDREGVVAAGARGACGLCGKVLTDPESIRRGIGPECYRSILNVNAVEHEPRMPEVL